MSTIDPRAEADLAAAFTRVHLGLAAADTDDAVLRAVGRAVVAHGPHALRLYTLHDDGDGDGDGPPSTAELASVWQAGVCPAEDPLLGRPFAVADHPVLARWFAGPGAPDRGTPGVVVLPLRAGEPSAWLGALTLTWPIEHITSPRERAVHALIGRLVAASLAARRALRRRQRALDEANTLHVAAAALAEATDLDDVLAALAEPAQAAGATWATLWVVVQGDAGGRLVRVAPREPGEPPARPLSDLSDAPGPTEQDGSDSPDPDAPRPVRLPLVLGGRPVGMIELGWPSARRLPAELTHLYAAIGELAAAALEGRAALAGLDVGGVARVVAGAPNDAAAHLLAAHPGAAVALAAAVAEAGARRTAIRVVTTGDATLAILAGGGTAVLQDISNQRRAEAARLAARDALLAAQANQLAHQAAPVLPLSDSAAAIPLVGALGGVHAAALAEAAAGLPAGTRTLLVDLTGVTAVAPAAAAALASLADAARARGVDVVFTGVRPALGLDGLPARTLADALGQALLSR